MADDPWAAFRVAAAAPTQDPWAEFRPKAPQTAAQPQPGLGQDAFDQRFVGGADAPKADHFQGMVTDFMNQGSAAGQRTTPSMSAQQKILKI